MLLPISSRSWSCRSPKYDDIPESTVKSEGLVIWVENGFWFGSRFGTHDSPLDFSWLKKKNTSQEK